MYNRNAMNDRRNCLVVMLLAAVLPRARVAAAQSARAPSAANVFCAHGGVGTWPSGQVPPYYAVVVVDIDLHVAARSMLGVTSFELLEAAGGVEASLAAVEEVVQLPITSPSAQFATYLNPAGTPLTRPLPVGVTRVRIRMRLNHRSLAYATRYRMTLSGLGAPVTATGAVNGSWPT